MPTYIRAFEPGGTFFFTLVTHGRIPMFNDPVARTVLRAAIEDVRRRRPFDVDAIVLLPDHLHCIWTLPADDHDFSTRWRKIKEAFTRAFADVGGPEAPVSPGQKRKGLRGYWQQRFWEHTIRDERDFERHVDYIHYNPVKHGHVRCPHAWAWSSFSRWVKNEVYERHWLCSCGGRWTRAPRFEDIDATAGE